MSDRSATRAGLNDAEQRLGGVWHLAGPRLENCRYDRMFLAGPATWLVSGYLVPTIRSDRPCVWIHVVHEQFSWKWLDSNQENSRASDYSMPIYLDGMIHIVELRYGSLAHC